MKTKTISKTNMLQALSQYMMALSVIDDNEKITKFKRVPEGYEVTVEKSND